MGTSEVTPFFFFLIVLFVSLTATTAQRCSNRACSGFNEPVIGFPFRLKESQPELCGYPGFDLTCNSRGETVLKLPFSGEFNVQSIDYKNQEIWINDPDNCLAGRLMRLNLTGSPFRGVYIQRLIFFNCSSEFTRIHRFRPITCLSNSEFTVLAALSMYHASFLSRHCSWISSVLVPVQSPFYDPDFASELSGDLMLAWEEPNCGSCEERGGRCRVKNNTTLATVCSDLPRRGLPRVARYAISVGVGIPALMCLMGLICYVCGRFKSYGSHHRGQITELSFSIVSPRSRIIPGLDGSTIESFPKIVLGESRRIPEPNDNICPICLSEYRPGETLRSIPECQHCFHTDCIDEWLQLNATCPVCRNSPEKTTSTHAT